MSSLAGYLRKLAEKRVYDFEDIIEKYACALTKFSFLDFLLKNQPQQTRAIVQNSARFFVVCVGFIPILSALEYRGDTEKLCMPYSLL
jgi:hypothetical protein